MGVSKISVTVDVVVFKKNLSGVQLLLIQRKHEPFQHFWALPGGFVDEHEDLEAAAVRELYEETGIGIDNLQQLTAFGKPHRDPRGHTISIPFCGFVGEEALAVAGDDAENAKWFSINELPALAFDHAEIIRFAISKMEVA